MFRFIISATMLAFIAITAVSLTPHTVYSWGDAGSDADSNGEGSQADGGGVSGDDCSDGGSDSGDSGDGGDAGGDE